MRCFEILFKTLGACHTLICIPHPQENEFLQNHMIIVNKIKCQVCPFTFLSFMLYVRHFQNDHDSFKLKDVFYCNFCRSNQNQLAFQTQEHWRFHMNLKHANYVMENWKLCKFCIDQRFETNDELEKHTNK